MDKIMQKNLQKVQNEVENYRSQYGQYICTNVRVFTDICTGEKIASYCFMPEDVSGYTIETNLATGKTRHCGIGRSCFWTDWE